MRLPWYPTFRGTRPLLGHATRRRQASDRGLLAAEPAATTQRLLINQSQPRRAGPRWSGSRWATLNHVRDVLPSPSAEHRQWAGLPWAARLHSAARRAIRVREGPPAGIVAQPSGGRRCKAAACCVQQIAVPITQRLRRAVEEGRAGSLTLSLVRFAHALSSARP